MWRGPPQLHARFLKSALADNARPPDLMALTSPPPATDAAAAPTAGPEPPKRSARECLEVLLEGRLAQGGIQRDRARRLTAAALDAAAAKFDEGSLVNQVYAFMDVLEVRCGQFLHTTMLKEIASGTANIAVLIQSPVAKLQELTKDPPPRQKALAHLYEGVCSSYKVFVDTIARGETPDGFTAADLEKFQKLGVLQLSQLVKDIERSAYNTVVQLCEQRDPTVMRSWDNPIFLSYYRERIAVLYGAFNVRGQLVKKFGLGFVRKVLLGEIAPARIGKMTSHDIHPEGYRKEQNIIDVRRKQRVNEKVSTLFRCPVCKVKRCTYREVQDRSPDEPTSIYCTCQNCGNPFQAH